MSGAITPDSCLAHVRLPVRNDLVNTNFIGLFLKSGKYSPCNITTFNHYLNIHTFHEQVGHKVLNVAR